MDNQWQSHWHLISDFFSFLRRINLTHTIATLRRIRMGPPYTTIIMMAFLHISHGGNLKAGEGFLKYEWARHLLVTAVTKLQHAIDSTCHSGFWTLYCVYTRARCHPISLARLGTCYGCKNRIDVHWWILMHWCMTRSGRPLQLVTSSCTSCVHMHRPCSAHRLEVHLIYGYWFSLLAVVTTR